MPHQDFAKKYNRRIKVVLTDYDRIFSISCAPENSPDFARQGSFYVSADTHFEMLMLYARHFEGHRMEDVVDDLLLLQVDCRIF